MNALRATQSDSLAESTSGVLFSSRRSRVVRPLRPLPAPEPQPALLDDDGPLGEVPWPARSHPGAGHLFLFMR